MREVFAKLSHRGRHCLQERGATTLLKCEERLRHALIPRYQQLFTQISRLESGVKFLVDMRSDLLVGTHVSDATDYVMMLTIHPQSFQHFIKKR